MWGSSGWIIRSVLFLYIISLIILLVTYAVQYLKSAHFVLYFDSLEMDFNVFVRSVRLQLLRVPRGQSYR